MPLYGTPQSGSSPIVAAPNCKNITSLEAGQQIKLLNGTETIATGSKSVAFSKGFHDGFNSPVTYNLSGCAAASVVAIQTAGADVDTQYTTVATLTPDTNGNQQYTLTDSNPFARAYITTYNSPDAPVLTATRM